MHKHAAAPRIEVSNLCTLKETLSTSMSHSTLVRTRLDEVASDNAQQSAVPMQSTHSLRLVHRRNTRAQQTSTLHEEPNRTPGSVLASASFKALTPVTAAASTPLMLRLRFPVPSASTVSPSLLLGCRAPEPGGPEGTLEQVLRNSLLQAT